MASCKPSGALCQSSSSECLSSFSYYQKVPDEMPPMEKHQVYGLATPEDFSLPPHHPLWTEETYAAFQVTEEAGDKYDSKVGHHTCCDIYT